MSEQGAGPPPNGLQVGAGASMIDGRGSQGTPSPARLGVVGSRGLGRGRVPPSILFQESLPRRWGRAGVGGEEPEQEDNDLCENRCLLAPEVRGTS